MQGLTGYAKVNVIMPEYKDAPEDHETVREDADWYYDVNKLLKGRK